MFATEYIVEYHCFYRHRGRPKMSSCACCGQRVRFRDGATITKTIEDGRKIKPKNFFACNHCTNKIIYNSV